MPFADPEKKRAYDRAHAKKNRARKTQTQRRWCAENRRRVRDVVTASNHRIRFAGGTLSTEDIAALRAAEPLCAYCTAPADTIDHCVPASRGGANALENCVMACRSCNSRKQTKTPLEFVFPWPQLDARPAGVL